MPDQRILIVDDEKNIRLTMTQALQSLGCEIRAVADGQEALQQLTKQEFSLILLDLKMPDMDGLEVLRQVVQLRPDVRVIIVSAHGTVENAVEAIKLGAVDFIQKPFTPPELRQIVATVLDRNKLEAAQAADYATHLALTKRCINERHFEAAMVHARQAIGIDSTRAEAFNLIGVLHEIAGDPVEAMKNYRVAVDLDPTYEPAWQNLHRPKRPLKGRGEINLG